MPNPRTFFSYSRTDSVFTLKLAKDLREGGVNVWLDQLDIKAGSRWDDSIEDALDSAPCLIIILSPESVASNNVMDEVSFALENGKTVIPVLLSDCKVPFRINRLQRIDFTGDYQLGLDNLLRAVLAQDATVNSEQPLAARTSETSLPAEKNNNQPVPAKPAVTSSIKEGKDTKHTVRNSLIVAAIVAVAIIIIWVVSLPRADKEKTDVSQNAALAEANTVLKIGDVFQGGVIFDLDKSGLHGLIAKEQDLGLFAWEDAQKKCEALGEGWHLPTIVELTKLYQNKEHVGGFDPKGDYWSSSEVAGDTANAYGFEFDSGQKDSGKKDIVGSVRPVKSF